jgi:hypothetical protein
VTVSTFEIINAIEDKVIYITIDSIVTIATIVTIVTIVQAAIKKFDNNY